MKNLSLILNIILSVAVIALFVLHFSGDNDSYEEQASAEGSEGIAGNFTIAYIHSDSLLDKYQYVIDENARIQKRTQEIESDYRNRAEGLQQEVNDYQANYSNLTIGQARAIEENLAQKQQNLQLFQESARQELIEMEAEVSRNLYSTVTEYLEVYSAANGVQMVVKFDTGSDVLFAGRGLDITDAVIDHLNEEYLNPATEPVSADSTGNN